jgi:malate dehydrogenase
VPVKLGQGGAEQILEIELTLDERSELQRSAAAVKELVDIIGV